MYIITTGSIGAGKGEVGKFLQEKGFKLEYFHTPIQEECEKRGLPNTRENWQKLAGELRAERGTGFLGALLREKVLHEGGDWVLDGSRNPEEIVELRQLPECYVIGVAAPLEVLIDRVESRQRELDGKKTREEIKEKILFELGEVPNSPFAIAECLKIADLVIENTGTLEELKKQVEDFLEKVKKSID